MKTDSGDRPRRTSELGHWRVDRLDYELPEALIAQKPLRDRAQSRLLVVHRPTGNIEHRTFSDVGDYLNRGDLLIANESRVIPARLFGHKEASGGKVELLLLRKLDATCWVGLAGGARTRAGTTIRLDAPTGPSALLATIVSTAEHGERTIAFSEPVEDYLEELGHVPLPPYIHRPLADPERYQTVYARTPGSAAAPTAGLHFTEDLILELRDQGVGLEFVTLHVGLDTFRPITEPIIEQHQIHREWCHLSPQTAQRVNRTKASGRRIISVGTTSVRVLETAARRGVGSTQKLDFESLPPRQPPLATNKAHGCNTPAERAACPWHSVGPFEGFTDLYIVPGFDFRVVDALITNFHLPKSTLLALVMAFAGEEITRRAYREAIQEEYRFFSFGDAMLIL